MSKRTTLVLDEQSRQQLDDLIEHHGTQTAAVRQALALAHAAMLRRSKRQEYIDWLIGEGGEPTEDDRAWARRVATEVAALREATKQ